jgi:glycosyltransferase involved in cell wall biosynthesis
MVSIIVSNYNYGQYLSDAINSALNQTECEVEVIVVDDGSTDHSRDIIGRYGDRIIPILKRNGGQASALNAGFTRSRGEIVIFLDADDALLPDIARRVSETFGANFDAAKVQYRMEVIDAQGSRSGVRKPASHLPLRSGDLRRHVLTFPFDMTWMATSGNAFARSALNVIFPIPEENDEHGRVGADWYVVHLAALCGSVVSLDEVGALYRVHDRNHYEVATSDVDLPHVRQTIAYAQQTRGYIQQCADRLQLPDRPRTADDILSVSDLANRLISLKLDRAHHPLRDDRVGRLLRLGMRAALRRFDVSWVMRLMFCAWFVAMAVAPHPMARELAERFLYPEKRTGLNHVLRRLHAQNS